MYSYIMTITKNAGLSEELTQEVFYRAMKSTFQGQSSELTWLCAIAKNLCTDEFRKRKKETAFEGDIGDPADNTSQANVEYSVISNKRNTQIKAGVLVVITGIWIGLANDVLNVFLAPVGADDGHGLGGLDLSKGFPIDDVTVLNANLLFLIITVSVCIGALMICSGIMKEKKEHESEK